MNRREFLGASAGIIGGALIPFSPAESSTQPKFVNHREITFLVEDLEEILAVKNLRDIYAKRAGFAFAADSQRMPKPLGDCAVQFIPYPKDNGTLVSAICAPIDTENNAFNWVFSVNAKDEWVYRKRTFLNPFSKKELKCAAEIVKYRDERLQFWNDNPEVWEKIRVEKPEYK